MLQANNVNYKQHDAEALLTIFGSAEIGELLQSEAEEKNVLNHNPEGRPHHRKQCKIDTLFLLREKSKGVFKNNRDSAMPTFLALHSLIYHATGQGLYFDRSHSKSLSNHCMIFYSNDLLGINHFFSVLLNDLNLPF